MKSLIKIASAVAIAGVGATMYAAPGSVGDGSFGTMLGQAENLKGDMSADYERVIELQMIARKEKDVIKLNCVNDKLVAMKPELNIGDQSLLQLQTARNGTEAKFAFDSLSKSRDQVKGLREAAEACVGQHLLLTESSNDFTHPDIPDSPDNNPWGPGAWTIEPPAYASPVN
jgi:hypothetical protein